MEIKEVIITTRAPSRPGDPGNCEIGFYFIADGFVQLCSEDGKPKGKKAKLNEGADPRLVAGRLMHEAFATQARENSFQRKIVYDDVGWR